MDLGFTEEFDLYINESLTQKNRELLAKVKEFKRVQELKTKLSIGLYTLTVNY